MLDILVGKRWSALERNRKEYGDDDKGKHEMPGWMKHKLESRLLGEISITSDMQMTPPLRKKAKKN